MQTYVTTTHQELPVGLIMTTTQDLQVSVQPPRRGKTGVYYSAVPVGESETLKQKLAALPPQARVAYGIVLELSRDGRVSEKTLIEAFAAHQDKFSTRQEPWRIMQFYRRKLIHEGLLFVENSF